MSDLRRPGLLVLWLLLAGCQAGLPQTRARLDHEGAVYVYLEPLTPEAERLRVSLEASPRATGTEGSCRLRYRSPS